MTAGPVRAAGHPRAPPPRTQKVPALRYRTAQGGPAGEDGDFVWGLAAANLHAVGLQENLRLGRNGGNQPEHISAQ